MIYFDLDGVIRSLSPTALGYPAPHWWHKKDGKTIVDLINEDLRILTESPPTEYYPIIKELPEINIITHQPEHWKERTTEWISHHFPGKEINIAYVNSPEEKMEYLYDGDYLVEDYPFFKDYSRIILIDRAYNGQAAAPVRIYQPEELRKCLKPL